MPHGTHNMLRIPLLKIKKLVKYYLKKIKHMSCLISNLKNQTFNSSQFILHQHYIISKLKHGKKLSFAGSMAERQPAMLSK